MKTEEIAQWVIDNRYSKSENNKVSDSEMYYTLIDKINEALSIGSVTPRYFYVVEKNYGEDLEQLSIGLETLEQAKTFKDSDYHKKRNPNAFIVCTINEG